VLDREYRNIAEGEALGFELEWEQQISEKVKWGANLSYATSEDTRSAELQTHTPPGMAEWMANAHCIARPLRNLLLGVHLNHVGERAGEGDDIEGYDTLDLSLSVFHLGIEGLSLRASVKNLFDDEVRYILDLPTEPVINQYDDRRWGLQLAYQL